MEGPWRGTDVNLGLLQRRSHPNQSNSTHYHKSKAEPEPPCRPCRGRPGPGRCSHDKPLERRIPEPPKPCTQARFPGLQYFAGRPRGAEAALLGLRTLQGSGFRLEAGFYGFTMVFVGVCLGLYGFPWVSLALLHGGFGHARCRRSCDNILHSGFGPGLPLAFRFPALFVKLKVPK